MKDFIKKTSMLCCLVDPCNDSYQVFPDQETLGYFAKTGDQNTARLCCTFYEFEMTCERMNYDPEVDDFYYQFVLARFVDLDTHKSNIIEGDFVAAIQEQKEKWEKIKDRLEYLRRELRAERIGTGELIELASLKEHISAGDVELLEAAGVPEHTEDVESDPWENSYDSENYHG